MGYLKSIVVAVVVGQTALAVAQTPWDTNTPIVNVEKAIYRESPEPGVAAVVAMRYVGPNRERMETRAWQSASDLPRDLAFRLSYDNGQTWTEDFPMPPVQQTYSGVTVKEHCGCIHYDPTSEVLVNAWIRQINRSGKYYNFTYYRISQDMGMNWSEPKQLCYEPGAAFDPDDPLNSDFLDNNHAYYGSNFLIRSDGKLVHAVAHANAPDDPLNDSRAWRLGSLCFVGTWNPEAEDYQWEPGERVSIPYNVSSRGLMEPEVAELKDGRVAVVWRGSNAGISAPGRKWFSISTDGGLTLSEPAEWKYDDGTSFYSPSSFHRMIRHSVTDKLYWLGNISETNPSGNSPRYPLVIAEVDEDNFSLKKDTVTVIDDRQPGQPSGIQFSNFSLLEDRETRAFEVYLTAYGETYGSTFTANAYKYIVTLNEIADLIPGDANLDGEVTDEDASILAAHWQQTGMGWKDGDFDNNGIVDDADASILAAHWSKSKSEAVPEPSSIVLLALLGLTGLVLAVRHQQRGAV